MACSSTRRDFLQKPLSRQFEPGVRPGIRAIQSFSRLTKFGATICGAQGTRVHTASTGTSITVSRCVSLTLIK
ncbi:hypothetical protein EI94DRAFT_1727773 [Lactarius quietus]|nr:hypothetical protein EI94DRAFT_1727773 [Lactarius quietus]